VVREAAVYLTSVFLRVHGLPWALRYTIGELTEMWNISFAARRRRFGSATAFVAGLSVGACTSTGVEERYRFNVVNQPVATGANSPITVRITETSTETPVGGATFSDARLTMRMQKKLPPGKQLWQSDRSHSEDVRYLGSVGTGQYRLLGDVSMPGTWTLHLKADVPGETSPVEGSTKFVAAQEPPRSLIAPAHQRR
jgi:hypothetical protein